MRGWRAFYADGRAYASTRVAWQELPARGLVGVVVYLSHPYRRILDGHDWIYLEDGEFVTVGTHPEWGRWTPKPDGVPADMLKRGAAMPDGAWEEMQKAMMEARTCP